MTREKVYAAALCKFRRGKSLALELPTGMGKSRMAIGLVNTVCAARPHLKMLLLVAKTIHKQNWADEIQKWGGFTNSPVLMVECYESLKKHAGETFDVVIADEAHHLRSEMRQELLRSLKVREKLLFLSATFPKPLKHWLRYFFHTVFVTASLQDAISDNVLPEPEIRLIPLKLNNTDETETVEINPKVCGKVFTGRYATQYWNFKRQRVHARLTATKKQYLQWLNTEINYSKNVWERTHFEGMKFKWLQLCNQRLKFLADCKTGFVSRLLRRLDGKRTLTFCKSIEQTERLGRYCVHSKNRDAAECLRLFNEGRINHLTACQVLNEGMNLTDCQYGIFANLNASEVVQVQRVGRVLRHRHPVIVIPYYKETREEEIVSKMLEGYNRSLVKVCDDLADTIN